MDAGTFIILLIIIFAILHIFDAILDFVKYRKPKHEKNNIEDKKFWEDRTI